MAFTVPMHPIRHQDSYQGPLEPVDITDNSPPSLYVLCAKYIVQNISKITIDRKLPAEICDNLIELFPIYGSKKVCNSFLYTLSSKQCSVVSANLSNLDITDEELTDFVDAQAKTLRSLNLAKCGRLSSNILFQINRTLLKVHDVDKLCRLVSVYEVPKDCSFRTPRILSKKYPAVIKKFYHNGKVRTVVNKEYPTACSESYYQNSFLLRMECPEPTMEDNIFLNMTTSTTTFENRCSKIPKSSYELNREMGLFCDPHFTKEFLFDMEPSSFACYDRLVDDHRTYSTSSIPCPLVKATQIIKSKQKSLFPEERIEPNQCAYCYGSGLNRQKIMILPKSVYHSLHFFRKFNYQKYYETAYDDKFCKTSLNSEKGSKSSMFNEEKFSRSDNITSDDLADPTYFSAPEDDDDSHSSTFFRSIHPNPKLQQSEIGYFFNTLTLRSILGPADPCLLKMYGLPKSRRSETRSVGGERPNEELSSQIDSISELDSSQSPSMSAATSSSCPILSSCVEATYLNLEGNQLQEESLALIDDGTSGSNNHNFPRFLKKFRPHSHNTFEEENHQKRNSSSKDTNAKETSPMNFSPTSSFSFISSNSSNIESFGEEDEMLHESNAFEMNTHEFTCPLHPQNCPPEYDYFDFLSLVYNTESTDDVRTDLVLSEDSLRFDLFPYKLYRIETPHYPYVRLIEVVTWSPSQLQSLNVTRSVEPNLQDMRPELRQSIILNRDFPCLKRLTIHDWPVNMQDMFFNGCRYLERITYLDLSYCGNIGDGQSLTQMTNLETLILYNVDKVYCAIDSICKIKSLKVLDISGGDRVVSTNVTDPIIQMQKLISSLPNLVSLDISGTLWAVGINALAERENRPLEFLGIFHTNVEPPPLEWSRVKIPALKIAGDTCEDLILNSCEAYMNRPEMLSKCLNELFQIFRYENGQHDLERAVKILACALGRHPNERMIQVAASATLFYIIKSDEAKPLLGRKIKELIVTRLLDAMQTFRTDQTMLRNGCLNLIHFRIPGDVISEYTRLADILLYIVALDDEDFVQRLGIYLLNSLACQVDGEQKTIVGNLGAIEKMLHLIESRYNRNICDEVMETAWSTMWNVTDETPINCERFLNNNGMDFFVSCMEKFPEHPELLRNMMGLLGNVSECAHLRYRLMKENYITRFVQLLDSQSDGIEVSYNSAGILAHIASDGAEIWNRHLPACNRDDMLQRMEFAISRWEINSKRNINYRSFEPILRLLRVLSISWQAQFWAVWALANLTRVHSAKYCTLLEKDGGVEVLKSFIISPRPDNFSLPSSVKCLAIVTLFQYYLYNRFGHLKVLEKSKEISCFDLVKPRSVVMDFLKQFGFTHLAPEIGVTLDDSIDDCDLNDNDQDVAMIEITTDENNSMNLANQDEEEMFL